MSAAMSRLWLWPHTLLCVHRAPVHRAPLIVRARPRAQAQYLARLLAMVGIMVPPERVMAAAGGEPAAGWVRPGAPEPPRGRPGAGERAPRAREDALVEQVHAQTLICPYSATRACRARPPPARGPPARFLNRGCGPASALALPGGAGIVGGAG